MLVPTCECGVVFIARRLLKKNVPTHVAMTYLFAAPVINPLVLAATYVAFRGNLSMVLARVFVVAACACVMGAMLGDYKPDFLLREGMDSDDPTGHDHSGPNPGACPDAILCTAPAGSHAHGCGCQTHPEASKVVALLLHTTSEFLDMGKYLVLGAVAVGTFKLFTLSELLLPFQNNVYMAVGALMLLAIFLSICSEMG